MLRVVDVDVDSGLLRLKRVFRAEPQFLLDAAKFDDDFFQAVIVADLLLLGG